VPRLPLCGKRYLAPARSTTIALTRGARRPARRAGLPQWPPKAASPKNGNRESRIEDRDPEWIWQGLDSPAERSGQPQIAAWLHGSQLSMEATARTPFRYGVCGIMVNRSLSALCLDLDDPWDDVALTLAGLAQPRRKAIDDCRRQPDQGRRQGPLYPDGVLGN
jgi:hypothetical protein